MKLFRFFLVLFSAGLFSGVLHAQSVSPQGLWWSPEKDSKIEIYEVDHKLFGKIAWLPPEKMGKKDDKNPKDDLKSRPILGLELLTHFEKRSDTKWGDGEIYDPKSGKTYQCKMTLVGPDKLEVRGFVGISLFGRTETFERVKADE